MTKIRKRKFSATPDLEENDRARIRKRIRAFLLTLAILGFVFASFYLIRPESVFNRPQELFDSAWKLDLLGHYLAGILVAFWLFFVLRFVIVRRWLWHLILILSHAGIMAWFEKGEFGFDWLIQPWFPHLDKLQKGEIDTMLDLVAADTGLLTAYFLRWLYGSIFPSEALKEYMFHLAELSLRARKEARQLALEYRRHRKEKLMSRLKAGRKKLKIPTLGLSSGSKAGEIPNRPKPRP